MEEMAKRIETHRRNLAGRTNATAAQERLTALDEQHRQLRSRFDAAQGGAWDKEREHIAREHSLLYDTLVRIERELDEDQEHPHGRAPGARSGLV
jgi:hypothetical protein